MQVEESREPRVVELSNGAERATGVQPRAVRSECVVAPAEAPRARAIDTAKEPPAKASAAELGSSVVEAAPESTEVVVERSTEVEPESAEDAPAPAVNRRARGRAKTGTART